MSRLLLISASGSRALTRREALRGSLVLAAGSATSIIAGRFLSGCAPADPNCRNDWLGAATGTCFPSNFQPGEVVFEGQAEADEELFVLRDRLAREAGFTNEQMAILAGLLYYTVEQSSDEIVPGEAEDLSQSRRFSAGERVRFRLMRVALAASPSGEADQYELLEQQYAGPVETLPPAMAVLALRPDGSVRLPDEEEFVVNEPGTPQEYWQFVLPAGERVVFLDVTVLQTG